MASGITGSMLVLRSLLFNALFYLALTALMLFGLPVLLFGRHGVFWLARIWARGNLWMLRVICGVEVEYRGLENLPGKGGFIIAPKHQSVWETFALLPFVPDFTFILKRELTYVPLFGWYLKSAEQIAIDRSSGRVALNEATSKSRAVLAAGRQIFIFPEGTRRPAGAPPVYKFGVSNIYADANVPCVPVALNSGLFWPRRTLLRWPGKVLVEFLEPIPPGLDRQTFLTTLQDRLEAATNRLIRESLAANPSLRGRLDPAWSATN